MIERQKKIVYKNESYIINFPTVGKMIDSESLKQSLTSNRYGSMTASGVKTMYEALDLVDAVVFFSINCPRIKKVFSASELTDLQFDEGAELVKIYKEQILPWYNETLKELYNISNGEVEK